jgi:hypothetical protein
MSIDFEVLRSQLAELCRLARGAPDWAEDPVLRDGCCIASSSWARSPGRCPMVA